MKLAIILFAIVFLLIFTGVPIAVAVACSVIVTIQYIGQTNMFPSVAQKMFTGLDSFSFLAIPFFVLAGNLMERSGISKRLVRFFKMILFKIPAASACITVVSCAFFGAVSGSSAATTAAIGGVMVPNLREEGYNNVQIGSILGTAGILGVLIPPSVPLMTYAVTAGYSVGKLFMAGVLPGVLLCLAFCALNIGKYKNVEKPMESFVSGKEAVKITMDALWALGMPIIILGGIYGGFFTATEAAVIACIYSLIVGCFIYKELSLKSLVDLFYDSAKTTAIIQTLVALVAPFSWIMASKGIASAVVDTILNATSSYILIMLCINLFLLFLGCFLEPISIILLVTPLVLPLALSIGYDPVVLGAMIVVNCTVGLLTPPMAPNLFLACRLSGLKNIGPSVRQSLPYLGAMLILLLLMSYVPSIFAIIPNLMN